MMSFPHTVSTTMEDYLEAIAWLIEANGVARVRDIAAALSVHKSTVTAALKNLAEKKLLNYSAYEAATLTTDGKKIAEDVIRRHKIVREFFKEVLALEHGIADTNACRIEHVLDAEVLDRLASFAESVKNCHSSRKRCLKQFQVFFRQDHRMCDAVAKSPETDDSVVRNVRKKRKNNCDDNK
jgi:DtxR family transcriptional regulator, Mn-dependent transcriptional regulator